MVHNAAGKVGNLWRHRCREKNALTLFGHLGNNLHDVVGKAHIQHSVGFVEHEMSGAAQVEGAEVDVGDESTGSGDDDVGTRRKAATLLLIAVAVVAAIYCHAVDVHIITKSLQGLVYLSRQLSRGRHDEAVDGIGRVAFAAQYGEQGQQIGCRFARAGLGYADEVFSFKDMGNTFLLNGCALVKSHIIECIKQVVVEVKVGEEHFFFVLYLSFNLWRGDRARRR